MTVTASLSPVVKYHRLGRRHLPPPRLLMRPLLNGGTLGGRELRGLLINMDETKLNFALDVDDGWPPVGLECLPFEGVPNGYRARSVPLFVKDLSVNDVIAPEFDDNGLVTSWTHVRQSEHTTVWLLRLRETAEIASVLADLRTLGCNTCSLDSLGCHAIDVPAAVSIADLDKCLDSLDETFVAVAFPSFRHPE